MWMPSMNESAPEPAGGTTPASPGQSDDDHSDYCRMLMECEQKMIDEFDKAVMALSGGAIGVSFAFLKDIVKTENMTYVPWLLGAWVCWGFSVGCVLTSFYFSHLAMRLSQKQWSSGERDYKKLGGIWNKATLTLNPLGGGLFLIGVLSMIFFVSKNVTAKTSTTHTKGATNATAAATITTPNATAAATVASTRTTATATTAVPSAGPEGRTNAGAR
jgi:hypothetical protein